MQVRSLVKLLSSRQGQFVPTDCVSALSPKGWTRRMDDVTCTPVLDSMLASNVKDFWLHTGNFFGEAPIPKALGLAKPQCEHTSEFLNKELDLYLQSNSSIACSVDGKIVGAILNAVWKRNDDYEVINADIKTWHNAAAEIVYKNTIPGIGHLIWRDYQYQHIYNSIQMALRNSNKTLGFYAGMGTVLPAYRGGGYSQKLLFLMYMDWALSEKCILCTLTTLPAHQNFKELMMFFDVNAEHVVDEVKYSEQNLVLDGKKVFSEYANLGCLGFHTVMHN